MTKPLQKRTLATRARLIIASENIIAENGFEALRVEEVVKRASTAKGTFFAHFKDKDALMEQIIGARLNQLMDSLQKAPTPTSPQEIIQAVTPLCNFMTRERYVFDIIMRYSGAAGIAEIGPIAVTFGRQIELFSVWISQNIKAEGFRSDVAPDILAEGLQAFMLQALATHFCALHNAASFEERFLPYLETWLSAPKN